MMQINFVLKSIYFKFWWVIYLPGDLLPNHGEKFLPQYFRYHCIITCIRIHFRVELPRTPVRVFHKIVQKNINTMTVGSRHIMTLIKLVPTPDGKTFVIDSFRLVEGVSQWEELRTFHFVNFV